MLSVAESPTSALRIRCAMPEDAPAIRAAWQAQKEWLGLDELPLPPLDWPVLYALVVEDEATKEVLGALFFEVGLEMQVVVKDPRAMKVLAAQQASIMAYFDNHGFKDVSIRAFVPHSIVKKMRHTLARAGFETMDYIYSTFIHLRGR